MAPPDEPLVALAKAEAAYVMAVKVWLETKEGIENSEKMLKLKDEHRRKELELAKAAENLEKVKHFVKVKDEFDEATTEMIRLQKELLLAEAQGATTTTGDADKFKTLLSEVQTKRDWTLPTYKTLLAPIALDNQQMLFDEILEWIPKLKDEITIFMTHELKYGINKTMDRMTSQVTLESLLLQLETIEALNGPEVASKIRKETTKMEGWFLRVLEQRKKEKLVALERAKEAMCELNEYLKTDAPDVTELVLLLVTQFVVDYVCGQVELEEIIVHAGLSLMRHNLHVETNEAVFFYLEEKKHRVINQLLPMINQVGDWHAITFTACVILAAMNNASPSLACRIIKCLSADAAKHRDIQKTIMIRQVRSISFALHVVENHCAVVDTMMQGSQASVAKACATLRALVVGLDFDGNSTEGLDDSDIIEVVQSATGTFPSNEIIQREGGVVVDYLETKQKIAEGIQQPEIEEVD